jgi:hypothetical protein
VGQKIFVTFLDEMSVSRSLIKGLSVEFFEVGVMVKKEPTKHERVVAAIVEQTLRGMTKNHMTVTEIMTAATENAQRKRDDATTVRWPQKITSVTTAALRLCEHHRRPELQQVRRAHRKRG